MGDCDMHVNFGMAGTTGAGLAGNVLEAYLFLADNYNPQDQIFLFGFSRGAYTVSDTILQLLRLSSYWNV